MQIHEITQRRTSQVDEGIGSAIGGALGKGIGAVKKAGTAVASPFRDAAAGYRGGKVDAQVGAIADKAYRAWSTYRQQLDKSAPNGKADPSMVEKQLLAFVSKNLLGGQYLPNLINKDQIIKLVKQIATTSPSSTGGTTTATSTGLVHKANPANPNQPQPAATAPGAGTFGQMAGQLGAKPGAPDDDNDPPPPPGGGGNPPQKMQVAVRPDGSTQAVPEPVKAPTVAPGVRVGKAPSTPAGTAPATEPISIGGQKLNPKDPKQAALIAKAQAATKPPIKEAAGPELELFKKLVTAAGQAQSEVATGAGAGSGGKKVQDPKQLVGAVTQAIGSTVDAGKLKAAGDAIRKNFQIDASIGSTEDDAVDALLMNMGFQPA
jgi:hypothetical protein